MDLRTSGRDAIVEALNHIATREACAGFAELKVAGHYRAADGRTPSRTLR
ncbi:hypothetical protein [Dactylosporangium darangshiense]